MQKRTKQLITGVALLGAGAYGTLTGDDAIPWVSGFIHAGAENTASLLNNFSPGRFGPGGLKNIMYATDRKSVV